MRDRTLVDRNMQLSNTGTAIAILFYFLVNLALLLV